MLTEKVEVDYNTHYTIAIQLNNPNTYIQYHGNTLFGWIINTINSKIMGWIYYFDNSILLKSTFKSINFIYNIKNKEM